MVYSTQKEEKRLSLLVFESLQNIQTRDSFPGAPVASWNIPIHRLQINTHLVQPVLMVAVTLVQSWSLRGIWGLLRQWKDSQQAEGHNYSCTFTVAWFNNLSTW